MATSVSALSRLSSSYSSETTFGGTSNSAQTSSSSSTTEDTVKLSAAAQAVALYRQGNSVQQIAASLGLSTSLVDSYVGITTSDSSKINEALVAMSGASKK
jgi:DNA-binding NarL/FixJ family response regulator